MTDRDAIAAVHLAARQYCTDRSGRWQRGYASLQGVSQRRTGQARVRPARSSASNVYPRYLILDAILAEVERFVPEDFASEQEARQYLTAAADTAGDEMTRFKDPVAAAAAEDERRRFGQFVTSVSPAVACRPLPYRRVLGNREHDDHLAAVVARWGSWNGGGVDRPPAGVETATLHVAAMGPAGSYDLLRAALADAGYARVFELREYGNGFEVAVGAASFQYTGAEGFWTVADRSWLVYASHEASITFGGRWLVERMRAVLPEFERYDYKGWDLAAYG